MKTMLAGKAPEDLSQLRWPRACSPKLDGVRGHVINSVVVSRNQLAFRNPTLQVQFGREIFESLDGEFMAGDPTDEDAFRQTGTLNSFDGSVDKVVFWVFDDFSDPYAPFYERLAAAERRIEGRTDVRIVPHTVIHTPEAFAEFEAKCVADGYEGAMSRDLEGFYKYGRSTTREGWLIKHKRFVDSEMVIDDAKEKMHNANEKTLVSNHKAKRNTKKEGMVPTGVLGAVIGRDIHDGRPVELGSGFNDAERAKLWALHLEGKLAGLVAKYKHFPSGSKDRPRFPIFQGFRDPIDL